ncbi:MAG: N-acetylglucosamine-6-phosphate deacetylase [Ilumatobacteraceae bacterium]|nr:N-acetylglucosamine-6-phosphate deacetylase [Ilumatobacteraceae bacterium]
MARTAIWAGGIARPTGISGPATIVVDDGRIESIADGHLVLEGIHIIEADDEIVSAGLIDIHTHGGAGVQAIDGDLGGLQRLSAFYARHGVTGFLGTIGGSRESIVRGLHGLTALIAGPPTGARCLGVHMEGPFISPCCPGAFRMDSIVAPDVDLLERYLALGAGAVSLITLAPEIEGTLDLVRAASAHGVVCSAGHSDATEAQMLAALGAGVTSMTHMFNAMRPLHHREPGIVGVGLTEPAVTVEVIADGVHLHPRLLRLLAMTKGFDGVALITDSIAAAGLDDGTYHFEEQEIVVANGEARLVDGTLAGSTLTMECAVRNFAAHGGIAWHESLASATEVPARLLGLQQTTGRVEPGLDADLVGFDAAHEVRWTMVGGDIVFRR